MTATAVFQIVLGGSIVLAAGILMAVLLKSLTALSSCRSLMRVGKRVERRNKALVLRPTGLAPDQESVPQT